MNPYQVPGRIITFFNYGLRIMKCGDLRKMAIVQCNCFPLCLPHLTVTFQGVFRNNFILACEKKRKTGKKVLAKKKYKNLNHQNLRRSNFWQEKDWQQSLKPCYPKTKRRTSTEADLSFGPNLDIKHWIRGGQWVAVGEYYPNKQRNDSWRLIRTTTSALKGLL